MKTVWSVLSFAFLASTASAATVFVPCEDYGIPVPHSALPHAGVSTARCSGLSGCKWRFNPHPGAKHHHRHRHAKGHRGARHALLRGMCPVWLDESLGGPAGAWPASSGWFEETAGTDLWSFGGVDYGMAGEVAASGLWEDVDHASPPAPIFIDSTVVTTNTFTIIKTDKPCWRATAVPETGTWILMLIGFASLILGRRIIPCGALR